MGSSGGGGMGSGEVTYPAYIQEAHWDWLDDSGTDLIDDSVTAIMNNALGNSPFLTASAYNPTGPVDEIIAAPGLLQALVTLLSFNSSVDALAAGILDDSRIQDSVTAFNTDLNIKADAEIYPRFEAGMRDIGAVMSSAFVIGRANIAEKIVNDVARYEADIRYKAWGEDAIQIASLQAQVQSMKLEYQKTVSQFIIESNRIKIVAFKEQVDTDVKYDEADATWDLSVFQYGGNLMAAPAGGVTSTATKQPSTAQSMIGGAMSGAAAGALLAAPTGGLSVVAGATIGGLLGAAGGLL